MKKRLLVTASTFPRWDNDTEPRFVLDLCAKMTDEFDVTILVPAAPGAKSEEIMDGVKVVRYHYFPIHKLETLCYPGAIVPRIKEKKVRLLLVPFMLFSLWVHILKMQKSYDVAHAHWLIPQGVIQSFFKIPYVVTGHGGDVGSLNYGPILSLKRRCLQKASAVTAVSQHLADIEREIAEGISPQVISMGVDTSKFGRQYRKDNFFNQGQSSVVLFVGRLAEKKGVSYLLEAMRNVDAVLIVIGTGPLEDELKKQAEELGSKVRFLGSKSHNELKEIYASSDVFVMPSITAKNGDREGLGLVILEAMASGLPVVASRSGGITQLVQEGENGLLCDEKAVAQLSDAINRILTDKALRNRIIAGAAKTVSEYDYTSQAEKYKKLLNRILEARSEE